MTDLTASGFAQEIGPDFGFENQDNGGLHGVQDAADAKHPVEREINHLIGKGHALFGEGVTGLRGGGPDQGPFWIGFFQALGQRIRDLRKRKGFSQEDMISHGFSARHWQQIEHGRPITLVTLLRICDTFEVRPEKLLRGLYSPRPTR